MILSIIITIIACVMWWWLIQQSLQFYRLRTSTMLVLVGLSMIGVASIISFPHLYTRYTSQARTIESLTTISALSYLGYTSIIGLLITLVVFYRSSGSISQQQIMMMILLIAIGVGFPKLGRYPLYYYLIAAGVEEYVKYYIGLGSFKLYGTTSSDIILFGMLSGLGFACIENVVYLVSMIHNPDMVTANILRRVVGPIVHMIYSGGLAYGYRYLYRRGWGMRGVIISMICITIIHMGYNSWIGQGGRGYIIAIIVLGYGIISWMTYQCDRLYFEAKNNLKTTT